MTSDKEPSKRRTVAVLAAVFLASAGAVSGAWADDSETKGLLHAMSEYMAAQQKISFKYDTNIEIVTTDLEKLDFASTGSVVLIRPDKLRVSRSGGFADVELMFDGHTATVFGRSANQYANLNAPGTIDELIDVLRTTYDLEAPGADLLLSNVYDKLIDPVFEASDLGTGIVGGVECNHLAFRTHSVDWQIWIAVGPNPYPCRYTVTSKLISQAPQYSVQISDWKTGDQIASDDFSFKNATNATEVKQLSDMHDVGELPDWAEQGGTE